MPKVSVIVPLYNVEDYLKRSLDSLVNQTLKDIEIILVDDCSTDKSLKIAKEYSKNDKRIKVINSKENQGAAAARNKGLDIAKGEYIGFIDADDYIDLNYYEELYKKAKEDDYDIVKCQRVTIDKQKRKISSLNKEIAKNGLLSFHYEWTTAIYKSSIVFGNNIRFPDEIRKGQDAVFLFKILLKSDTFALIDNVNYYYYKRGDSLNTDKLPLKSVHSALNAISIICDEMNRSNLYEKSPVTYVFTYMRKLGAILCTFSFRNKSFASRKLCMEFLINNYHKCKDKERLKKIFKYKWMIPYIEKRQVVLLTMLIMLYRKSQYLFNYKPIELIFSIKDKKIKQRKYKMINILGIRIKLRQKG